MNVDARRSSEGKTKMAVGSKSTGAGGLAMSSAVVFL